jgi:hypothetical protein
MGSCLSAFSHSTKARRNWRQAINRGSGISIAEWRILVNVGYVSDASVRISSSVSVCVKGKPLRQTGWSQGLCQQNRRFSGSAVDQTGADRQGHRPAAPDQSPESTAR